MVTGEKLNETGVRLTNIVQSTLIIVQRDATQSSLFIILQVDSTRFGCQPHPSSGVHKTVTTASGTGHIFVQLRVDAQYRRL